MASNEYLLGARLNSEKNSQTADSDEETLVVLGLSKKPAISLGVGSELFVFVLSVLICIEISFSYLLKMTKFEHYHFPFPFSTLSFSHPVTAVVELIFDGVVMLAA